MSTENTKEAEVKKEAPNIPETPFINPSLISSPKEVPITEEHKEKFFKSFLADKPYSESFELFGGKQKIILKSLTNEENKDIFYQIQLDTAKENFKSSDAYMITIASYRMALSLTEIDGKPVNPNILKSNTEADEEYSTTYVSERAETFKNWQTYKLSAYLDAYREFENRVGKLTVEVLNPDFWVPAKQG